MTHLEAEAGKSKSKFDFEVRFNKIISGVTAGEADQPHLQIQLFKNLVERW